MSDNKFSENFKTALEGISAMADANTVIGEAVTTANGTTIIPVSKMSMGYATGGLDYTSKKAFETGAAKPASNYGGVGGTGLTVSPVAFLVVSPAGNVELLNVNQPAATPGDPVSSVIGLIERSPEIIEKLRHALAKDKQPE